MELTKVLIKPIITEKSTEVHEEHNRVTFLVHPDANKIEIKQAVESIFSVRVLAVNVVRIGVRDRYRQMRLVGHIPGYKKAYVTLDRNEKIDYFEGV